jgi:methylthioribose-1-phosphate isomerase
MKRNNYFALDFKNDKLIFLDQTKLPFEEIYIETDDYNRIAEAIEKLEVRGAPAIGVAASYALALSLKNIPQTKIETTFNTAYERLKITRPTAVNLFMALDEIKRVFDNNKSFDNVFEKVLSGAMEIHKDDIEKCERIGENGTKIFKKKSTVLTHCNTGKLATSGDGTAFNVIKKGFEDGLVEFVYADETRPLLQGSRLTAFELEHSGIPFAIQTDSSAASLMQQNKIDLVVVGADRIALNGDTANKIGTYNLAVLCNYHDIPFYIAAPFTTIDKKIATGEEIVIEHRNKKEITSFNNHPVVPESYETYSPAFDVTPSHLITGIITDKRIYFSPYNFINE